MIFDLDIQIVVRYCRIEMPYWQSFVDHYFSCGIRKLHVCVQNRFEIEDLRKFVYPGSMKVHVHLLRDDLSPNLALRAFQFKDYCKSADYTAVLDCDEYYFSFDPGVSIGGVLSTFDAYIFKWILRPSILRGDQNLDGVLSRTGKQIALSSSIDSLFEHGFLSKKVSGDLRIGSGIDCGIGIVHYWSRTFGDAMLKTFNSKHKNAKSADQDKAADLILSGDLPVRLRILAYLANLQGCFRLSSFNPLRVNQALERELIDQMVPDGLMDKAYVNFKRYRRLLTANNVKSLSPISFTIMDIAERLPSLEALNS